MTNKESTVSALQNGTVIDHIPVKMTFKVAEILDIGGSKNRLIIASNLESAKHGMKGLIKVSNAMLGKSDLQKIALVAPNVTISQIKEFKVVNKTKLERPKLLTGIVKCFNPNCITNSEPIESKFIVEQEKPLVVRCRYCERNMVKDDVVLL